MADYASLEIGLYRYDADHYSVELRYMDSDEEDRSDRGIARFDFDQLRRLLHDAQLYGEKLTEYLFADSLVREMYTRSYERALARPDERLRLRLFVDKSARDLHGLCWETLTDPRVDFQGSRLADHERILFSRYLRSARNARERPQSDVRALAVVANPRPHPAKPKLDPSTFSKELDR